MGKLMTVQKAKQEVQRLQHYLDLVESYEADTLEKWIVKEYAYTNSFVKVVERARLKGYLVNGSIVDKPFVTSIINGKANDELHKLMKSGYKQKIKPNKRMSQLYR